MLLIYLLATLSYEVITISSSFGDQPANFIMSVRSFGSLSYVFTLYCYVRIFWEVNRIMKRTVGCNSNNRGNLKLDSKGSENISLSFAINKFLLQPIYGMCDSHRS